MPASTQVMSYSTIWSPKHSALHSLLTALSAAAHPLYIVGGLVRDHLLGGKEKVNDLDVIVEHSALQVARQVADRLGWAFYALDPERDVARLVFQATSPPLVCDIAAMRGGSIEHDLRTRDFTINALAIEWEGRAATRLVDLVGGRADLERRLLRRVSPSSLAEDPVRLLRAVRFAAQLGFSIEEETQLQMLRMADTVSLASAERQRDELWKMMLAPEPAHAIELLDRFGLLAYVLPEVGDLQGVKQSAPHVLDAYRHTLQTVRFATQFRRWLRGEPPLDAAGDTSPGAQAWQAAFGPWRFRLAEHFMQSIAAEHLRIDWLVWHALLHDIGKAQTRTSEVAADGSTRYRFFNHEEVGARLARERLEALRFSRQEIWLAETVIEAHMRPHHLHASFGNEGLSRRACFRYFRDTGGRNFDQLPGVDVVLLALADYQAISCAPMPPDWQPYLQHAGELLEFAFHAHGLDQVRQPLVDGHTLMRYFDLKPGREIGNLLQRLQEAQAAGEIANADEALAMAATWVLEQRD
jgi:poly(A) polymerase/tRNA nucleotidyltransferase (CCA-adding enzyme)